MFNFDAGTLGSIIEIIVLCVVILTMYVAHNDLKESRDEK